MSAVENLGQIYSRFRHEQTVAIVDYHDRLRPREVTFQEFDERCRAVARGLHRLDVRPGDFIGIISFNRTEFLEVFFGAMTAGVVPVPINARLPAALVAEVAADADLRLLFTDGASRHLAPLDLDCIDFDDTGDRSYEGFLDSGEFRPYEPDEESLAFLIYTSGSTGRPKGVQLSHRAHSWVARQLVKVGSISRDSIIMIAAPMYHKNALNSVKQVLAGGARMVILPRFDPRLYIEAADRHRATHLAGVPTMYALMLEERELLGQSDLATVRQVRLGSAPASTSLLDALAERFPDAAILYGYGITESSPIMFGPHPEGLPRPRHSIGWPLPTTEYRLVGDDPNEGLFLVRTPGMMSGYHKLPEETARRMNGGFFNTGDILRRDSLGWFYFVGRSDDMFVSGGNNIYPGEVEALLERHPDVHQAVVVPSSHPSKGQVPVAFVVVRPGAELAEEEVKHFALENAAPYLHPRRVFFLPKMPLNAANKIDRNLLREGLREKESRDGSGSARTGVTCSE